MYEITLTALDFLAVFSSVVLRQFAETRSQAVILFESEASSVPEAWRTRGTLETPKVESP
jgi:hypothetical protein